MPVCPVCETPHAPAALECATCGHIFQMAAVDGSIVPMEELEPTDARDLDVPIEQAPDLEPTAFEATARPTEALDPSIEPTAAAPVQVVDEVTPDLLPTREAEDELPSALPTGVRCRYCGSEGQAAGLFCDRCGMRLPRLAGAPGGPEGDVSLAAVEQVCRSCGSKSWAQGRCAKCGARQPQVD